MPAHLTRAVGAATLAAASLLGATLLAATLSAAPAQAQPAAPEMTSTQREEARALFDAGRAAFTEGRFDDARDYFLRSYEISHLPELLFNVGHAAELLQEDEQAIEAFERYLRDADATAEERAQVTRRLERLRARLAARAVAPIEPVTPVEPAPPSGPDPGPHLGPGPFVTLGGGGVAAVVGAVLLALAADASGRVTEAPQDAAWADYEGAFNDSGSLSIAGGVLVGAGAAAIAAGVVWLIVSLSGDGSGAATACVEDGRFSARF